MAAITLGSNSFNMMLAYAGDDFPRVYAKHKRKVRLARGLTPGGCLDPQVAAEALDCLRWFGEILADSKPCQVAVYATAALRQASDAEHFCQQALPLLGYPIEIISGDREAELIFHGMRATTDVAGRCLMIDIGGASTELVIGDQQIDFKVSLPFGAVLFTERFFGSGCDASAFLDVHQAVGEALAPYKAQMLALGWQRALGISGSFRSVFELHENRGRELTQITAEHLQALQQQLLLEGGEIVGLDEERQPTFAAGVAILSALMALLDIDGFHAAGGALREGVLAQLNATCQ